MALMLIIRIFNTLRKELVILFSPTFASFAPIRISFFWDLQDLTQTDDRKQVTILINELKFYSWGCAKMLTAFFKISLSCRNISFSRFKDLISSSSVVWCPFPGKASFPCSSSSLHHLLKALSEMPRSLAICVLLFPLVRKKYYCLLRCLLCCRSVEIFP